MQNSCESQTKANEESTLVNQEWYQSAVGKLPPEQGRTLLLQ